MRAAIASVVVIFLACGARTPLDDQPLGGGTLSADAGTGPRCGDGVRNGNEECDDGNTIDTDSCTSKCLLARCGDGIVHAGVELCDDGNRDDTDSCRNGCGPASCGDGVVEPPETCDDGNTINTDACLSSCVLAFCGDGIVHGGVEACDDGDTLNTNDCLTNCTLPRCGDGFVWAGHEQCDDGNNVDNDGCHDNCTLPVCGDGIVATTEACDLGAANGDRPAFLISQPSGTNIATNAIVRAESSVAFYDYRSASSHTGFEQVGESRIYLYVDSTSGHLALVLTHGIDFDSSKQVQPDSQLEMDITGIPLGYTIDVVDDNSSEFFSTGPTSVAGRWHFNQNSDGGVIGNLPFPGTWKISVTPHFEYGITTWGFVNHDLQRIPLVMTEPITIQAFAEASACRKNCTVPRCGDGILDGGEVCDDGNTTNGDGCNSTCTALR
jgi:cysteine-rich repeat protein